MCGANHLNEDLYLSASDFLKKNSIFFKVNKLDCLNYFVILSLFPISPLVIPSAYSHNINTNAAPINARAPLPSVTCDAMPATGIIEGVGVGFTGVEVVLFEVTLRLRHIC